MENVTFVKRVITFLKGGDEQKVTRFASKLNKYYDKQISIRKEKIESLQDKIQDKEESLNDLITNVDLEKIQTVEKMDSYVGQYHNLVQSAKREMVTLQEEIDNVQEEIDALEETRDLIFGK